LKLVVFEALEVVGSWRDVLQEQLEALFIRFSSPTEKPFASFAFLFRSAASFNRVLAITPLGPLEVLLYSINPRFGRVELHSGHLCPVSRLMLPEF